jgi:hypothetical protein
MLQEIIYDLLFGLRVQTSDIEGDQFELLPVRSHIGESPVAIPAQSRYLSELSRSVIPLRD